MTKKRHGYKPDQEVVVDSITYRYNEFYDRLGEGSVKPETICPYCHRSWFQITYGLYECIANCECGHSFPIYDG